MARAATRRSTPNRKTAAGSGPASVGDVMSLLDTSGIMKDIESTFKLVGATVDQDVLKGTLVPTGVLTLDLVYNGGLYPGGFYIKSGFEMSGKSTALLHVLASMLNQGLPLNVFMEPECTSTRAYVKAVAGHMLHTLARRDKSLIGRDGKLDTDVVFGKKDSKGKWIITPRVWHYPENITQTIWKSLAATLRRLPDKSYEDGEWWLLFMPTAANRKKHADHMDKAMSKKTGKVAVKSPDGGKAQAMLLVDSLANMVPEEEDEDDGSNAIGTEARANSRHAKKVKGLLRRKHALLVGVNQLRAGIPKGRMPAADREPGGNAIKGYSDVRLRMSQRRHKNADYMDKPPYANAEPSVEGRGRDMYRFIHVRSIKNKYGTPHLEEWIRLWEADRRGGCRGFDPVWDTWNYLRLTGQVRSTTAKGAPLAGWAKALHEVVMVPGDPQKAQGEMFSLPRMNWMDFKKLILFRGDDLRKHCAKLGIDGNPRLRERCAAQVASGLGVDLYHREREA